MNVLVLNAGSSSQKTCLYQLPDAPDAALPADPPAPLWQAETVESALNSERLSKLLRPLWSGPNALLGGPADIQVVGHRVVHGGGEFRESVRVTPKVKAAIERLSPLAPAHNPAAVAGIEASERLFGPTVPQVAVFDTAFHRTLSDAAAIYPGPYEWAEQGIRRYGFHGINHQYVAGRAAHLLARDPAGLRLISCHLGSGCSLAAIRDGISIDTTMGFTPLDGLMMGTRSGAVDPGLLLYLIREKGVTAERLDAILNRESGLKGISGLSGDMREIDAAIARGDSRARLAFDIYVHRLRAGIGAMLASLGGVDALVFTAGVGEHSSGIRAAACASFGFLGVALDRVKNLLPSVEDCDIAAEHSSIPILVIRAEEDWAIAKECRKVLNGGTD